METNEPQGRPALPSEKEMIREARNEKERIVQAVIDEQSKRIKEPEATLHQKEMEFTQLLAEFKDKQP